MRAVVKVMAPNAAGLMLVFEREKRFKEYVAKDDEKRVRAALGEDASGYFDGVHEIGRWEIGDRVGNPNGGSNG